MEPLWWPFYVCQATIPFKQMHDLSRLGVEDCKTNQTEPTDQWNIGLALKMTPKVLTTPLLANFLKRYGHCCCSGPTSTVIGPPSTLIMKLKNGFSTWRTTAKLGFEDYDYRNSSWTSLACRDRPSNSWRAIEVPKYRTQSDTDQERGNGAVHHRFLLSKSEKQALCICTFMTYWTERACCPTSGVRIETSTEPRHDRRTFTAHFIHVQAIDAMVPKRYLQLEQWDQSLVMTRMRFHFVLHSLMGQYRRGHLCLYYQIFYITSH